MCNGPAVSPVRAFCRISVPKSKAAAEAKQLPTVTMSVPMRRALDPVVRYNERLNRARSSNSNLALKLPAQASPAPPASAHKERPVRKSLVRASVLREASRSVSPPAEEAKNEEVPTFNTNPFLVADGIKKNPFLLADKAKQAPTVAKREPATLPVTTAAKAPPAEMEPKPIGTLTDAQRAELQSKRTSGRRLSMLPPKAPDVPPMMAAEETEVKTESVAGNMEPEPEAGVQVSPITSPAAANTTTITAAPAPPPAPVGDMEALGANADLLAAVAHMLPDLNRGIMQARAVAMTSEPLIEVVRRCQRQGKGVSKKKRRR